MCLLLAYTSQDFQNVPRHDWDSIQNSPLNLSSIHHWWTYELPTPRYRTWAPHVTTQNRRIRKYNNSSDTRQYFRFRIRLEILQCTRSKGARFKDKESDRTAAATTTGRPDSGPESDLELHFQQVLPDSIDMTVQTRKEQKGKKHRDSQTDDYRDSRNGYMHNRKKKKQKKDSFKMLCLCTHYC